MQPEKQITDYCLRSEFDLNLVVGLIGSVTAPVSYPWLSNICRLAVILANV
jgi:hypothetical protein